MRKLLLGEGFHAVLIFVAVGLAGAAVVTGGSGLMLWALLAAIAAAVLTFIERRQRPREPDGRTRGRYWPATDSFPYGTKVRTTADAGADDWAAGVGAKRRWGVKGIVIDRAGGHGPCYLVRHKDGSEAWYEPAELEKL